MKRRAAIFSIAALLLITVAITPAFAQMQPVATANATKTMTATANVTKTGNATTAAAGIPGFEAVFALAGLLAVAYLVMRQRR
jgi:PGF-CTERM protein